MTHDFDKDFWDRHWRQGRDGGAASMAGNPSNPYLAQELSGVAPGTALDAGCGGGAEAIWLASRGWHVTAADISAEALSFARAAGRAAASEVQKRLEWVEADLGVWSPDTQYDLVMTHYAHPAMPQLEFYDRIAEWVAPGGTLLIVAHAHSAYGAHGEDPSESHQSPHHEPHQQQREQEHQQREHQHQHPAEASATPAAVTARLDGPEWQIVTAEERVRTLAGHEGGHGVPLRDVVVRATRRAARLTV